MSNKADVDTKRDKTDKPTMCIDFDGVIHSYTSGWKGLTNITDPPVDGAIAALYVYIKYFNVAIYSSRSGQEGGIEAMQEWLRKQDYAIVDYVLWPRNKPPASVYLDDRGLRFEGVWPSIEEIEKACTPWYKERHDESR